MSNPKKSILVVGTYPPPYGGISVHIERLKNILDQALEYNCSVLDTSGIEGELKENNNISLLKGSKTSRLIQTLTNVSQFKGDLIHFHVSAFNNFRYLGVLLPYVTGKVTKIITIHSGSFIEKYHSSNLLNKTLIKETLKNFDYIITVNDDQKEFIIRKLKINCGVSTIPAFLPPCYPGPDKTVPIVETVEKFREEYDKVVVTSGIMLDYYGFEGIVNAVKDLSKVQPGLGLLVVSYDKPNQDFQDSILEKTKGIKNIKLLQDLDPSEFSYVLKHADIFIRATDRDGDAVSIREAMYFDKQIIASDCVKRPEGVLLFKTMDDQDLKLKLAQAVEIPDLGRSKEFNDNSALLLNLYNTLITN